MRDVFIEVSGGGPHLFVLQIFPGAKNAVDAPPITANSRTDAMLKTVFIRYLNQSKSKVF